MDFKFDLPAVDTKTLAQTGVRMPVRDISGKILTVGPKESPVEVALILRGTDSDAYTALRRARVKNRLERLAEAETAGKNTALAEYDSQQDDSLELLVSLTIGWENVPKQGGGFVEFSPDAVRAFYRAFPAVYEQADRWIGNRANFTLAR